LRCVAWGNSFDLIPPTSLLLFPCRLLLFADLGLGTQPN
jgi:hypothetical protein